MLLCNLSHDSVFLIYVLQRFPRCSSHCTRNGACYQRTILSEKPKGTLCTPGIFTNLYHRGRGFFSHFCGH